MTQPRPGIYRHFKGNEYELLYIAHHSETLQKMVVYRARYGDWGIWVRPLAMWDEPVQVEDKTMPRFSFVREQA